MGFTSNTFVFIFMPISIMLYLGISFTKSEKLIKSFLVGVSLLFYAWIGWNTFPVFIVIVIMAYLTGNVIFYTKQNDLKKSKIITVIACWLVIGFLFISKYLEFVMEQLKFEMQAPSVLGIVGISFVSFEIISYLMDIYRGDALPGKFQDVMLFFSFFPKLISGPIVLWKDYNKENVSIDRDWGRIASGIERIIIGYAKKAIIADTFGKQIASIHGTMPNVDTRTVWLLCVLYFFQIYYDFSGYSDIAIGLAKVFGIEIKNNFNFPYISRSITEFWRRWHISLGTWFREYVYIPLGGNRKGNVYLNLFVVFVLTGIWHGANWTYLVWGALTV